MNQVLHTGRMVKPYSFVLDRCPVCVSSERIPLWTWQREPFLHQKLSIEKKQDVVICASCATAYRYPPLERELMDRLHQEVDLELHDDEDLFDRVVWLRKRLPCWGANLKLLEVGCASGKMLRLLRDAGVEAHGIDPNIEAVAAAHADGFQVVHDFVENVSMADNRYHVVTFMHVLEHLDDPRGFLQTVRNLLLPEGCAYLEVPNLLRVPQPFSPFLPAFHRTEFIPQTLEYLLRLCGFEPVHTEIGYGIRVLARVSEPQTIPLNATELSERIQRAFDVNLCAKRLGEILCDVDVNRPETIQTAAAAIHGNGWLLEHFQQRLSVLVSTFLTWQNELQLGPQERWPYTLAEIIQYLQDDAQLALLLRLSGHEGIALPGHLGRLTFRTLCIDSIVPEELCRLNSTDTVLVWLRQLFRVGSVLHQIMRAIEREIGNLIEPVESTR